jgi:hypothetical protein
MTWQNDGFLLADRVKLFYTVSASPLNSIYNVETFIFFSCHLITFNINGVIQLPLNKGGQI